MIQFALSPERRRLLLKSLRFGLLLFVGGVIWVRGFVIPQSRRLAEIRPKIRDLRNEMKEIQSGLRQLPSLEEEFARLSKESIGPAASGAAKELVPPEERVPELLDQIAQAAKSSQVRLSQVKPGEELSRLRPGPSGFLELPIRVEATGGYHPLGRFLDLLERSNSLIRVRQLEIKPNPEEIWRHQASLTLQAYLLPGRSKEK